jgi:protein-S-isoprenylcysteine O-methyltransferase Ste14
MDRTVVRLVGAAVLAALAYAATLMGQNQRLVVGILVGLPSFVLMIISRTHLGKSFSVMPEAKALVKTGMYSRIQHPMYLFLDLFLLAIIVLLGIPVLLLVWGILLIVQMAQARREEKVLAVAFGAEYETYKHGTWF